VLLENRQTFDAFLEKSLFLLILLDALQDGDGNLKMMGERENGMKATRKRDLLKNIYFCDVRLCEIDIRELIKLFEFL